MFWEDKVVMVSDVVLRGAENAMNFIEAGNIEGVVRLAPIDLAPQKWEPPNGDIFKLNIASHCNHTWRREGLGIIIRNHAGLVMASMLCSFEMLEDKVQSHARMVLKALQFVKAIGLSRVIVEGCWRDLFRLLRTTSPCLANYGVLVDDILCLAKDCFVLSFTCIYANCNRAAKALAIKALSSLFKQVWLEDFLAVILPIIPSDYQ
jgi:hypothetical protein